VFTRLFIFVDLQKVLYDVAVMQKGSAFQPDLDEGGAHAGQYVLHNAFVDIAHGILLILTLHKELHQPVIFQHRHAFFQRMDVDDDLGIYIVLAHINPPS